MSIKTKEFFCTKCDIEVDFPTTSSPYNSKGASRGGYRALKLQISEEICGYRWIPGHPQKQIPQCAMSETHFRP